ncbi:MAG: bifunctional heptose 7-phosphate kinase/heptose 1-phosphate adenyltransferase [Flavobacteriales bacterium]
MKKIDHLFQQFSGVSALVIGDVMIDAYLWGAVERISPEAPVPVVNVTRKENRLGGAANVALNIAALGAKPIICSVIGNDRHGNVMEDLIREQGLSAAGLLRSDQRITTVKTRVISHSQQMMRIDEEQTADISKADESGFFDRIEKIINEEKPAVIIFEDYNKGVLTESLIERVIELARKKNIPTCVDPKKKNFFSYSGVTLFKPNLKELREGLKLEIDRDDDSALRNAVQLLEQRLPHSISLITLSERGVFVKNRETAHRFPAHIRNIADVSGAGDTVIAVAALCLALNADVAVIARLSNLAGGLVCEKVGVVPIDKEQLLNEARQEFHNEA